MCWSFPSSRLMFQKQGHFGGQSVNRVSVSQSVLLDVCSALRVGGHRPVSQKQQVQGDLLRALVLGRPSTSSERCSVALLPGRQTRPSCYRFWWLRGSCHRLSRRCLRGGRSLRGAKPSCETAAQAVLDTKESLECDRAADSPSCTACDHPHDSHSPHPTPPGGLLSPAGRGTRSGDSTGGASVASHSPPSSLGPGQSHHQ